MKLTTVLASVNNNPKYYLFVAKQIIFWNKFDIKFICVFVGENIPYELKDYKDNIILCCVFISSNLVGRYFSTHCIYYFI